MHPLSTKLSQSRYWRYCGLLLLVVILFVPLSAFIPDHSDQIRAQPALLDFVAQNPSRTVEVIVQMTDQFTSVEQHLAELGGVVTQDLRIINGFVAELPASGVRQLAATPGVQWVSLNSPVAAAACTPSCSDFEPLSQTFVPMASSGRACVWCTNTARQSNAYIGAVNADKLWNDPRFLQGQSISIAVVDSGIADHDDFVTDETSRVIASVKVNRAARSDKDRYGHGTHVAGIIGGDGSLGNGKYIGVAPRAGLINVKVSDENGGATAADVVAGLQWVNDNQTMYNIRVVNLSLNSATQQSYQVDPIAAAAEILWFNGIVVVASAGNNGTGALYPPANDPFVITVGAMDDKGTASISDDTLAPFSAFGTTSDGFNKPEVVAPGKNIVAPMTAETPKTTLAQTYPENIVGNNYFRMSGTSMAAPIVSGAVALLLQDEPRLTPDQVKYRLMATARPLAMAGTGAGYLDAFAAVNGTTTNSANTGVKRSQLLGDTGSDTWNSAGWGSASWGSASWGSTFWDN